MDIDTITSALEEVIAIQNRHDGVHIIHGIAACFGCYKKWVEEGIWEKNNKQHDFQKDFDSMLKEARHIDKTGFLLKKHE